MQPEEPPSGARAPPILGGTCRHDQGRALPKPAALILSNPLGEPTGKFHILLHVTVNIPVFFIFDSDQAGEILPMQFSHHLRNPGDASAQQHIDFAARGFYVLEMHQFQVGAKFSDGVHRIVTAGCEMSHVRCGANRVESPDKARRTSSGLSYANFSPLK